MSSARIQETRVRRLNDEEPAQGRYVLYWMQQSQRAEDNHALECAVRRANERGERLLVGFGLTDGYPGANLRHYAFLLQGLAETAGALERRGIRFALQRGDPARVALRLARDASVVVCDRGYLRHQRRWREQVAGNAGREVVQVEADAVVPIEEVSDKAEYAARTLRPKLRKRVGDYLVDLRTTPLGKDSSSLRVETLDASDPEALLDSLDVDRSVAPVAEYAGGTAQAKAALRRFLDRELAGYDDKRGRPEEGAVSHLAKYLHFGQISPVYVALRAREAAAPEEDRESFLEELLVRRELAFNFVHFTPDYDAYRGLPEWARATLADHEDDEREAVHTARELEEARTGDRYWNAAMREMRHTGYLHNHLRMYWGKRILAWTNTPRHAFRVALDLNNKYFLDGRDPASYANVAWLFGTHDRPWPERPVFGKVRSMTASGLERKCDIEAYVADVERRLGDA